MYEATLTIGLPHTNRRGLAEHLLLMHAGHIHWTAIADTIGVPLSRLRTSDGRPVYATFYFIEEDFPDHATLNTFDLDDVIRFRVEQRAYKRTTIDGQLIFDRVDRLPALADDASAISPAAGRGRYPYLRFGNLFITREKGNTQLRVTAPLEGDFSAFPLLPNEDNPYQVVRLAASSGRLGLIDERWLPAWPGGPFESPYAIDPDRDTNGAGLIYFANYIAFMNTAERAAAAANPAPALPDTDGRIIRQRLTAFYGNVSLSDRIRTRVSMFCDPARPDLVAVRFAIHRQEDEELICLSEAIARSASVRP